MTALGFFIAVAWEQHGKQIVLLGGVLAVFGMLARASYKVVRRVIEFALRIETTVKTVETTLTKNNGGSSVLDRLDLLVENSNKIETRTASLEEWRVKQEGETR